MTESRSWTVMRSRFPLGAPIEQLGTVHAADFGQASAIARRQFGRTAVVLHEGGAPTPALLKLAERRLTRADHRRSTPARRGGRR